MPLEIGVYICYTTNFSVLTILLIYAVENKKTCINTEQDQLLVLLRIDTTMYC